MKTIKHALLGIVAVLGTLHAEDMSERWQRQMPTGGRVYLPEGRDSTDYSSDYDRRYDSRREDYRASRARQDAFQEQVAMERRIQQLERARQEEARRRSIEAITRRPMLR